MYLTGVMVRVFANGLRDKGSIPDRAIPNTQRIIYIIKI